MESQLIWLRAAGDRASVDSFIRVFGERAWATLVTKGYAYHSGGQAILSQQGNEFLRKHSL
jgi:hypothetical protein